MATGKISLGDVTAFIQYSRQFTMPITQIASQMNMLQSGLASAERVFEFLDAPEEAPERAPAGTAARTAWPPPMAGRVTLENVSFRYDPDKPLIEDFTLDVAPGQTIAIAGPTGAGKTTAVNLLMRFYEIDAGRISIDGTDYRELTRDQVRRCFGMVLQDTWLFAGAGTTSGTGSRTRPTRRSSPRPGPLMSIISSGPCPTATQPCSTRTHPTSPPGKAAADDRPGVPGQPGHPHPRRGDQQRRHPH